MAHSTARVHPKSTRKSGSRVPPALMVVHPDAAGIDIGSAEHYVAVPEDRDERPVRTFGCLTPELHEMARWLKACGVTTVAMESTGVYWIPVAQVLEAYALEVRLVDAAHAKNVPGRKTDVQDCQWLRDLHRFGLLRGAFQPDRLVRPLRAYWRQREDMVEQAARQIQKMQKALEQMNLQLHKVLSDISGVSGLAILRAILSGQRDPVVLAALADRRVKAGRDTIVKALTGDYHDEQVFALRQAVELFDTFQQKIADCDQQIQAYVTSLPAPGKPAPQTPTAAGDTASAAPPASSPTTPTTPTGPRAARTTARRKNQPHFDLTSELVRLTGVDLTAIDGIGALTAQTVIAECGWDMSPFPSEKHFASWLGLCPNRKVTGGKVKSSRTRKVRNRIAEALRLAAQSLHHSKSALGAFHRRMKGNLGSEKAITATAHKLACRVYWMLKHGQAYVDQGQAEYQRKYEERVLQQLKKRAAQWGFDLVSRGTGELVS